MNNQNISVNSFIEVIIDGKTYIGLVLEIDANNGNVKAAVQGFARPLWVTPKVGQR